LDEIVESAVESLLGLFGENAPLGAVFEIATEYTGNETLADEIWSRYNERIKHREG